MRDIVSTLPVHVLCTAFLGLRSSAVSVAVFHWDQTEVSSFCLVYQTSSRWLGFGEALNQSEGQADGRSLDLYVAHSG